MGPTAQSPQTEELFRPRLDEQLKMTHPLIRLSMLMDWQRIEATSLSTSAPPEAVQRCPHD